MAAIPPAQGGARHALALVRTSWRRLTPGQWRLALAAGVLLGGAQGIGAVLYQRDELWWMSFLGGLLPIVAQAMLLLPGLAIAASVSPRRLPAWTPFAAAATIATLLAALLDWGTGYLMSRAAGIPFEIDAGGVIAYAFGSLSNQLLIGAFAALGCMYGIDAQRRRNALRSLQLDRVRVSRVAYESRLLALQARVEPRFLFDTLAHVEALYERDQETAAHLLEDLIDYLRAALPALESSSSTLAAELSLVRSWLDIARICSADRLWYALPDATLLPGARMPPMLLLPLVQHGVGHAGDARILFVSAAIADDRVRIVVTGPDNAFLPTQVPPALAAVRERLHALYGLHATLSLEAVEQERSRAILEIPHERTDRGSG